MRPERFDIDLGHDFWDENPSLWMAVFMDPLVITCSNQKTILEALLFIIEPEKSDVSREYLVENIKTRISDCEEVTEGILGYMR